MELSTDYYLILLTFIKLTAFGSAVYVISQVSKDHCFSKSMKYYKAYFVLAFILSFLNLISELSGLVTNLNIQIILYFAVSFILLLAVNEHRRTTSVFAIISMILLFLTYFFIFFDLSDIQLLSVHALGSIALYGLILLDSVKNGKEFKNIGFHILSIAFVILIISSTIELFYLYDDNIMNAYLYAMAGANSGFILVIIGFLVKIMLSEYNSLNTIALTDPLTGMNNRRGMYYLLESILPSFNRSKDCFSLITIDLDFFKKVNDTYGHEGGDIVLKTFSEMLKSIQRNTDISARIGGEEFVVVLPSTDKTKALLVAEKIRATTQTLDIHINDTMINITASLGVDTACEQLDVDELLKNADKALYTSKFSGRNQVTHFTDL